MELPTHRIKRLSEALRESAARSERLRQQSRNLAADRQLRTQFRRQTERIRRVQPPPGPTPVPTARAVQPTVTPTPTAREALPEARIRPLPEFVPPQTRQALEAARQSGEFGGGPGTALVSPLALQSAIAPQYQEEIAKFRPLGLPVGEEFNRVIAPLVSPAGLITAAVAPGVVLGGTAAAFGGGLVGGALEEAGVPGLQTPVGELTPRLLGEVTGGLATPAAFARPGSLLRTAAQRRLSSSLAERGGLAVRVPGGAKTALAEEAGEVRIPPTASELPDEFESGRRALVETFGEQRQRIKETEAVRRGQRAERLAASERAYEQAIAEGKPVREAFAIKRGVQSGPLEAVPSVAPKLSDTQERAILSRIDTHDFGRGVGPDFERDRARSALLSLATGQSIQENEILTLEKILGPEFGTALRKELVRSPQGLNLPYELAMAPKAILSSFDMSYPLRQGVMLAPGHPAEFARSWGGMFRAFGSEEGATAVYRSLADDPTPITLADGSTVTMGRAMEDTRLITPIEEQIRGRLTEKFRIPFLGIRPIRASNRAFAAGGNKLRGDVFRTIVRKWQRQRVPITEERLQSLSNMLQRFSGRGTLTSDSRIAQIAQATWWAPQTRVAGPQAIGQLFHRDGAIRLEAWRNMVSFLGTGLTILGVAKTSGLKVGVDPRDTDFGKIQTGNIHVNIWGPSQPLARTVARIASGQRKDIALGIVPTGRLDEAWNYFRSGLAPEWGAIYDVLAGQNYRGQPIRPNLETLKRELPERFLPLAIQDMVEAFREEGPIGLAVGPATFFGETVSTYPPTWRQQVEVIPEYQGISNRQREELQDFIERVNATRDRWAQDGVDVSKISIRKSIETQAGFEKRGPNFAQWAVILSSEKQRSAVRNPDYDRFIVEHIEEIEKEAPHLIDRRHRVAAGKER